MKTIAVLVPSFTIEYSIEILSGIYDYFQDKDVKVVIAQTKFPHSTIGVFDYQYWTSVEYLKAHDIDGYIFVSGVFASSMTKEQLEDVILQFAPRPVVSIGVDFNLPGVYSIQADCKRSFNEIVGHLKNKHDCKRIAFFSANRTNSTEALQRYDAFTEALENYNMPFFPELVFDGFFTDFGAEECLLKRYTKKEDIDFDALVCANDMMAIGALRAFEKLGVKVPGDVKVTGFDDAVVSRLSHPTLSTINQDVKNQGRGAAEFLYNILTEHIDLSENLIPLVSKFRQSCGCVTAANIDNVYYDAENNTHPDNYDIKADIVKYVSGMDEKNNLITLMDTVKCANTLMQFFYNFRFIADQTDLSVIAVNFFNDVTYIDVEDDFVLPESMSLNMLIDRETNTEIEKPGINYSPAEQLFPSRSLKDTKGVFLLHPIFSGEANYGYMLCKINNKNFADHIVHLKIIISAIAQSYEYTSKIVETQQLQLEKSDLRRQSITDELTQILNRRGFIDKGQAALDVMQETGRSGVIFFADMDDLKGINDTYGHEMGDLAIKLQSEALNAVFRETDVVGRIGGDEFGIVAVGMKMNHVDNVRLKIQMMNEKLSIKNNLPFKLSISLGAVDLQKSSVIKKLLAEADKNLYGEKRKKRICKTT